MTKVEKLIPLDVISDLPDKIKAKIPGRQGKEIFISGYNRAYMNGASEEVSFARGWSALAEAGFIANEDGQWVMLVDLQEESMFKRIWEKLIKVNPSLGDVHVNRPLGSDKKKKKKDKQDVTMKSDNATEEEFEMDATVLKLDEDQRLVYGWASIIEEGGQSVVDKQGDLIEPEELVSAAHDYITESREAHEMHEGVAKGHTVESIVFTKEVQKALGIDLGKVGWFICQKFDEETFAKFKSGELKAFSIGGKGVRVPLE